MTFLVSSLIYLASAGLVASGLDRPISTALSFQAGVIPPSEETQNKVVINYAVDTQALKVEHGDDGLEHTDIECAVQTYTETGKPVTFAGNTVQGSMRPEVYKQALRAGVKLGAFEAPSAMSVIVNIESPVNLTQFF